VTGSPGGSRIITTVLQMVVNTIDFGMNVAEATNAPRFIISGCRMSCGWRRGLARIR
jgi:gamma-glutamyltranspeptidase/glutathione hydrolase